MKKTFLLLLLGGALSGCWTFDKSDYPQTNLSRAGNPTNTVLRITGFEHTVTDYQAIHGYQTAYIPGYYGRHHYHPGGFETLHSVTYLPQQHSSDLFLRRAQDEFEKAGFILNPMNSRYTVDVTFEGPLSSTDEEIKKIAWELLTIFFFDYEATHWTAKLRIRETQTGRLVFHHDYVQDYEMKVFGLIPLFSIASCDETSYSATQAWCLAALTDRAVADATAFLAHLQ